MHFNSSINIVYFVTFIYLTSILISNMAVVVANPDKKKYNRMEPVLQYINKKFITVNDSDTKKANPILKHVIDSITGAMKEKSKLFAALYTDILYGGSFFDGLKVGKPEEFDIDLRLVLPKLLEATLEISDQPGFVRIQMKGWSTFEKNKIEYERFKGFEKFKDEKNYLLVNKVLEWMESTVTHALNTFQQRNNKYLIPYNGKNVEVALKKSGPALTTLITYGDIYMDVDLVAVFKLSQDQWPPKPFKSLPDKVHKKDFMIVPKTPKGAIDRKDRYWRMSFQEQEKVIITGLNTCKTALRMIKKLRDTQNHNQISSYFIKTVFLHEIDKQTPDFWNNSQSFIFMHMLKTYKACLDDGKIPYYWNTRNNLLQHIDKVVLANFKNFLGRVIDTVDKKIDENPLIIADYLSTAEEQCELKKVNFQFSTKKSKEQIVNVNSCVNVTVTETKDLISLLDSVNPSTSISSNDIFESPNPSPAAIQSNVNILTNTFVVQQPQIEQLENNTSSTSTLTSSTTDNNDQILSLLQTLQSSMNILQSDLKFALTKITHLEHSVQELKNDNVQLKNIVQNSTSTHNITNGLNICKQIDTHSVSIETINGKLENLNENVKMLQTSNDTLKNGLKAFVFPS